MTFSDSSLQGRAPVIIGVLRLSLVLIKQLCPAAHTDAETMSTNFQLPHKVLEEYFVPYTPNNTPSLYGVSIHSETGSDTTNEGSIRLRHSLLQEAQRQLAEAFDRAENATPPPLDSSRESLILPISILCSPERNSSVAADAAIRYLGHRLCADIVIIDLIDLVSRSDAPVPGKSILSHHFRLMYVAKLLAQNLSRRSRNCTGIINPTLANPPTQRKGIWIACTVALRNLNTF